jgi:hypothetical protein
MLTSRAFHVFVVLAAALVVPSQAGAAPLVIQSGSMTISGVSGENLDNFSLSGDGFSFQGRGNDLGSGEPACTPCLPGQSVGFDFTFIIDSFGTAQIGATDYGNIVFNLIFRMDGGTAQLIPAGAITRVTAPFFFGRHSTWGPSSIEGFPTHDDWANGTNSLFTAELVGAGTATAVYTAGDLGSYVFQSATYEFEPVPEPATLTLLGSGLGALALRRRRRTRAAA